MKMMKLLTSITLQEICITDISLKSGILQEKLSADCSPQHLNFYSKVETVLKNASTGEQVLDHLLREVLDHYKEDLHEQEVRTELSLVKNVMEGTTFTIYNFK